MTIKMKIANGFTGGVNSAETIITAIAFDMEGISATPTQMVLQDPVTGDRAVLNGTGFTYTSIGGDIYPTGGTLHSIDFDTWNGASHDDAVDFSKMTMDMSAVFNAIIAEETGSNPAALEQLLFSENWVYIGNSDIDHLGRDDKTADGVDIDLISNDVFKLKGGDDFIYSSDGRDRLFGGSGDDKLWGENDNDKIYGDGGSDTLWGGNDHDQLFGGGGRDVLRGNSGNDRMWGDAGGDIFDVTGAGQGVDRIYDWGLGNDKIGGVAFEEIKVTYRNGDTHMRHNDGKIIFVGDDTLTFSQGDFVA